MIPRFKVVLTLLGAYVEFMVEAEGGREQAAGVGLHLAEKLGASYLYVEEVEE